MSGGWIQPAFPPVPLTTGKVFPFLHVGGGAGWTHVYGMGVMASLNGDAIWRLGFQMPPTALPSGTCKLLLKTRSSASSGDAKLDIGWAMCAGGVDPSGLTLNWEGTQTLTRDGADELDDHLITLDATTPEADKFMVMDLKYLTASWSIASTTVWLAFVGWV